jgi:hypothetical protein
LESLSPWLRATDWYRQKSAVRVGRVFYPAPAAIKALHRHCKKIIGLTGLDAFPYQFPGSATALRADDRCLLFCCQHQLIGLGADQIAICPNSSKDEVITGNSMFVVKKSPLNLDTDLTDVCAFEFPTDDYSIKNLEFEFFQVRDADKWIPGSEICFMIYGYPTEFQNCDYEVSRVHFSCVEMTAFYDGKSHSPHVHRVRMERDAKFNPDGMSGGSVFFLSEDNEGFYVGFAGMIMRGGSQSDVLHFIDSYALDLFLKKQILPGVQFP